MGRDAAFSVSSRNFTHKAKDTEFGLITINHDYKENSKYIPKM